MSSEISCTWTRPESPGVKLSKSLRHCCYSVLLSSMAWIRGKSTGNIWKPALLQKSPQYIQMFLPKKIHLENSHFERQLSRKSAWNIGPRVPGSQGPRVPGPCQRAARGSRQRSTLCHWGPPRRSPATAALGHRYGNVHQRSSHITKIYTNNYTKH